MRIIIDDKIPYIRGQAERLGEAVYLPGAAIGPDDVRAADALIVRTRTRCDAALLAGSRVRYVATATIGYDHLDRAWLDRAGVGWTNCPGCNAWSVAQYVGSALLRMAACHAPLRQAGATVGIVGVGHVGRRVARVVRALGFRTLLCDPPRAEAEGAEDFVGMDVIEREADVITFHTPLSRDGRHATFHLAGEAFFGRLARRPAIINAARGEVVCTEALLAAMDAGRVGPVAIDTWENEPHVDRRLLGRAFIATPHVAGYSADGKATGTLMALRAVARHFGMAEDFDVVPPPLPAGYRGYGAGWTAAAPAGASPSLAEALRYTYDPLADTAALRARPDGFERQRGDYPLRREPWALGMVTL